MPIIYRTYLKQFVKITISNSISGDGSSSNERSKNGSKVTMTGGCNTSLSEIRVLKKCYIFRFNSFPQ